MRKTFTLGANVVTLEREGGVITFHRDHNGNSENRITHVYDDRADDPFGIHNTRPQTVAVGVFWACTGRMPNAWEVEGMLHIIRPVVS